MTEPKRLIDDPSTPPELRDALRRSAEVAPRPYDRERGLERLQAAVLAGTVASSVGSSASAAAAAKGGWLGWGLLALGTAAGLAGVVFFGVGEPPAPPEASVEHPVTEPGASVPEQEPAVDDPGQREAAVAAPAPSPLPPAVLPAEDTEARSRRPARRRPTARPGAASGTAAPEERAGSEAAGSPAPEPDGADRLREETAQLARVRGALEHAPAEALRLAREGQRDFPSGVFAEEREALVVFALDRLGRSAEAKTEAERFIARHPNGPLTSRVRAIHDPDRR